MIMACCTVAAQPANVRVAPVIEQEVEQRRRVTGETRALRRSALAAEESGLVIELAVDAGSEVQQGELIARLDSERVKLELAEARSGVLAADALIAEREAQAAQADLDLKRVEELLALESGSRPELDRARRDAAVEKARLLQAQAQRAIVDAQIAIIEQRLEDLEIRAPFPGIVVSKMTEVGQWVREGDPLIDLIEIATIEIRIDVPETLIERASRAKTVWVHLPALGQDIEAQLVSIIPQADPRTRLFPVRLTVRNTEGLIRPGMSAIAQIPTSQKAMFMLVPKDAVLQNETGSFVFVDQGGTSAIAPVERLFAVGDTIAVRSPIVKPGMRVVVEGNERLRPGQPLTILNAPATRPPSDG